MPREITLVADNIEDATEQIIHILKGADNQGEVIYFHGWFGWGASAVLKAVAKRLKSPSRLADTGTARDLGKIIHVDVSQWQSKRALQKAIAEELELPPQVMALFDQHDEEDDFDGVEQSDRAVVPYVKAAIMNELMARRFLVILHNGSGSYIDLWEAGVPVMGQLSKRVLWTSRGRFWHHAKDGHGLDFELGDVESAKLSDIAIFALPSGMRERDEVAVLHVVRHALYAEAEEVANYTGVPEPDMGPKIVIECILYMALRLRDNDHNINWKSHASNYWVCDGIIQDGTNIGRSAWEIGGALQRNMNCDFCSKCTEIICDVCSSEQKRFINRWVSVTNQNSMIVQLSSQATSFFWTGGGPEALLFEHSSKTISLRVIHLSHCAFSFSSPPFLSCSNLRFLLLDHCKDKDDAQDNGEEDNNCHHHGHHSQEVSGAWFQSIRVLELSYTDWYWLLSKDRLDLMVNLRELNVKGVGNRSISHLHRCSGAGTNSRNKLLKLRVVAESYKDDDHDGAGGDRIQQVSPAVVASSFPDLSSWHILKTVVLDGCGDLELINCNALPLSLESFTLISNVTSKIKSISFRGCSKLKTVLLRGLFDILVELDLSGTAIKTLDLSAAQANGLMRVFLLGCEKLNAILWPQGKEDEFLEVLRIDTTSTLAAWDREDKSHKQEEATSSDNTSVGPSTTLCDNSRALTGMDCYISLRDPRIFRSLMNIRYARLLKSSLLQKRYDRLHIEISSTSGHKGTKQEGNTNSDGGGCDRQLMRAGCNLYYVDDIISALGSSSQSGGGASNGDVFASASVMRNMWIWHCPPIPGPPIPDSNFFDIEIPEADESAHCYISIQDEKHTELLQGTTRQLPRAITLPCFVNEDAVSLHLHDSLSMTSLPGPAPANAQDLRWKYLKWCRLEGCPNLKGVVFTTPSPRQLDDDDIFENLETFWASQLLKARCIWDWSLSAFGPKDDSFKNLMFLHLDYCPRLVHVLPLYTLNTNGCRNLETLEIVCCGNLREVFPSDSKSQQQEEPREFPRLKRIHLYELPKLQRICGHYRMLAPRLEIVKVRGCWGLKRLPAVRAEAKSSKDEYIKPLSKVDLECEKDWWDNLEWDGEEAGHHSSHYKPTYSAYYKKQHLRASVLM